MVSPGKWLTNSGFSTLNCLFTAVYILSSNFCFSSFKTNYPDWPLYWTSEINRNSWDPWGQVTSKWDCVTWMVHLGSRCTMEVLFFISDVLKASWSFSKHVQTCMQAHTSICILYMSCTVLRFTDGRNSFVCFFAKCNFQCAAQVRSICAGTNAAIESHNEFPTCCR